MKKITLLVIGLTISLVSMSQTIHDFDAATNGKPTGEFAIYNGVKEPVYVTPNGKKFIKITTKKGLPGKKYIPVSKLTTVLFPVRTMTVRSKGVSVSYKN